MYAVYVVWPDGGSAAVAERLTWTDVEAPYFLASEMVLTRQEIDEDGNETGRDNPLYGCRVEIRRES